MTSNHSRSRIVTFIGAGFGTLVTVGAMICASDGLRFLQSWLAVWVLLPFCVLFLVGCFARSRGVLSTVTAVAIICGLGSLYYFYTLFLARPDAQGALIFLSLPFFQLMLVLLAVGIASLVCALVQSQQVQQPPQHRQQPSRAISAGLPDEEVNRVASSRSDATKLK